MAENTCIKLGARLVTINKKQEKDFIAKRLVIKGTLSRDFRIQFRFI